MYNILNMFVQNFQVFDATHKAVMGLKITEADVVRGKNQVKATILMASESGGKKTQYC